MKAIKITLFILLTIVITSCGTESEKEVKYVDNAHNESFGELRWSTNDLPITIQVPSSYQDTQAVVDAFENAVGVWNDALGFNALELNFEGVDVSIGKPLPLQSNTFLDDGIFSLIFPSNWFDDIENGVLALTSFSYRDNQILHADIIFNNQYFNFSTSPSGNQLDIESVLIHELGHLLGLSHVEVGDDPNSVMNPRLRSGDLKRILSNQDIQTIQERYVD